MINYLKWIYWNIYYLFQFESKFTLKDWCDKLTRTRSPHWKYKPFMFHNEHGKQWEINLPRKEDDGSFNHNKNIWIYANVEVDKDDDIVAITIYDETLKAKSPNRMTNADYRSLQS